MRILMLGDASTEHLNRWARHFRARGDQVWVASAQDSPLVDIPLRLPVPWDFAGYPLLVAPLKKAVATLEPDLVIAHYLPNYGLVAVLSGLRPNVVVAWGSDLLQVPNRSPLHRARTRLVATRADAYVVDAQMLVAPLVSFGAHPERVIVAPFGVDDDVLDIGARSARTTVEQPLILCNRAHEPIYRIEVLLHALQQLGARFPYSAMIANSGAQSEQLRHQAVALALAAPVEWAGRLCRGRYLESLARADIYVSTSPTDSTSVSLLEAMAAGLAVVVPDIPGNREWVTDGDNGLLYAPGDAGALAARLEALLNDADRRSTLGQRAHAHIAQAGRWQKTMRPVEALCSELVGP